MSRRFAWSLTAAVAVYAAIAAAARWLPRPPVRPEASVIEIAVIEPVPPASASAPASAPDPDPGPRASAEARTGSVPEPDRARTRTRTRTRVRPPIPAPEPEPTAAPDPAPDPARFAVAMESTVTSPSGVAVPAGRAGGTAGGRARSGGRGQGGAGGAGGGGAAGGAASGGAGSAGSRRGRSLPRLSRAVDPIYPAPARRLRIEGRVALRLDIDRDGKVVGARVVRGLGHGLDEAAIAAARRLAFSPGTVDGVPTPMSISFSFRFVLDP